MGVGVGVEVPVAAGGSRGLGGGMRFVWGWSRPEGLKNGWGVGGYEGSGVCR